MRSSPRFSPRVLKGCGAGEENEWLTRSRQPVTPDQYVSAVEIGKLVGRGSKAYDVVVSADDRKRRALWFRGLPCGSWCLERVGQQGFSVHNWRAPGRRPSSSR